MPVKTAMKRAIGTESTPTRRIWLARSGSQVRTSASARPASMLRRPRCAMKPWEAAGRPEVVAGDTGAIKRGSGEEGRRGRELLNSSPLPNFPASPLTSCCEARQRPTDLALTQSLQGPVAKLAHPLPGNAQHSSDLLQRMLPAPVQAEIEPEHLGIARGQRSQRVVHLFRQKVLHRLLFRISLLIGNEAVDHGALGLVLDRSVQPDVAGVERSQGAHHVHGETGSLRDLLIGGLPAEVLPKRFRGAGDP